MRVCQPGPVAFHRSITSLGRRSDINLRGFGESGLPPLLTFARASMSSVSSGSSSYSFAFTTCASTRARSDFKERRDASLFAFIGFPHAENVTIRATRRVAQDNQPLFQQAIANNSLLTVVPSCVFNLKCDTSEDQLSICEVQPTFSQCYCALGRIEGDCHAVIVATTTVCGKRSNWREKPDVRTKGRRAFAAPSDRKSELEGRVRHHDLDSLRFSLVVIFGKCPAIATSRKMRSPTVPKDNSNNVVVVCFLSSARSLRSSHAISTPHRPKRPQTSREIIETRFQLISIFTMGVNDLVERPGTMHRPRPDAAHHISRTVRTHC